MAYDLPLPCCFDSSLPEGQGKFHSGIPLDGALAVVTRMEDKTVTVLDLKPSTPRLIIDTSVKICALGVAGSAATVVCE